MTVKISRPVAASHTSNVPVLPPVGESFAIRTECQAEGYVQVLPRVEGADFLTGRGIPYLHRLVTAPEASRRPSGLNATLETLLVCPLRMDIPATPSRPTPSQCCRSRAEASRRPSGLNATL